MLHYLWLAIVMLACGSDAIDASREVPLPRPGLASSGAVRRVEVKPDTLYLNVGDIGQGACTVYGNQNTVLKYGCSWKSLDTTVVKVGTMVTNVMGVTAKRIGKTRIVGTAKGKADTVWAVVTSTVGQFPTPSRMLIYPDSVALGPSESQQFCTFVGFANGHVAIRQSESSLPTCLNGYATSYDSAQRAVTAEEQRAADLICVVYSATGGVITSEPCTSTPS